MVYIIYCTGICCTGIIVLKTVCTSNIEQGNVVHVILYRKKVVHEILYRETLYRKRLCGEYCTRNIVQGHVVQINCTGKCFTENIIQERFYWKIFCG